MDHPRQRPTAGAAPPRRPRLHDGPPRLHRQAAIKDGRRSPLRARWRQPRRSRNSVFRSRAEEPGKPDRELLEDLAHRKLGMSAVRRIRSRFGLSEDEAIALGVRAAHDARREA